MRYGAIVLLLAVFSAAAFSAAPFSAQAQQSDRAQQAQALVESLLNGDYATVYDQFSDTIKAVVTQDQLQQAMEGVIAQAGDFQAITDVRENPAQNEVVVTVMFANITLDAHVVFNGDGKVAGLNFATATNDQPTPTPDFQTPTYANPSSFSETDVTVGDLALPGVLTMPVGAGALFPAVALISGSGPNDHDETIGQNKPFRDIAWGLASQGIASVRFDKRTFAARASLDLTTFTVKEEFVDDALAAVNLLRGTDGIDPAKVFLLGHSLGGYVAPRIAAADPQIAGVIIASGLALPLPEVLAQTRYLVTLGNQTAESQQASIDAVQNLVDQINALTPESPSDTMLLAAPPSYWLDLRDYDPVALAAVLPQPILVLQGERDYQVTLADDFARWQAGLADHADTTFKTYPDLNHIYGTGTGMSTPDEYDQPGNVAQAVIDDIAAWIKAH